MLKGSEVKSLREGRANTAEAYAREEDGQIVMVNSTIPMYAPAGQFNHDPARKRVLLVKEREYNRLIGADGEGFADGGFVAGRTDVERNDGAAERFPQLAGTHEGVPLIVGIHDELYAGGVELLAVGLEGDFRGGVRRLADTD